MSRIFSSFLAVLFLVIATFTTAVTAGAKSTDIDDYWIASGLSFRNLEKLVNQENCYSEEQVFLGCIHAINTVLAFSDPAEGFVPNSRLASIKDKTAKILGKFGAISLVEFKKSTETEKKKDVLKEAQKYKQERRLTLKAWAGIFHEKQVQIASALERARTDGIMGSAKYREKEAVVVAAAYNEYLSAAFDPHTSIQPTDYLDERLKEGESDTFFGIGAVLQIFEKKVTITSPLEGSPALKAGLRAKDVIVKVNNELVTGKPLADVVKLIRGPENTTVELSIQRRKEVFSVKVTRGAIERPNISVKLLNNEAGAWAYVKLNSFMERNGWLRMLTKLAPYLDKGGAKGVVIDLRGNGGGLLNEAVSIAEIFVPAQSVIVEQRALIDDIENTVYKTKTEPFYDGPVVVLVDANSASASEILSGALQDLGRAVIVGERTFGKGSVQYTHPLAANSKVTESLTVARFYLPSGRTNQAVGVTPDIEVFSKPNPSPEDKFAFREEDLYVNALPPVGPAWIQPRPEYIAKIEKCRAEKGSALKTYNAEQDAAIPPDYQLLVAEDVIACMPTR